jgi:ABC-type multidrug transport system ATPase subunit
MQGIHLKAGSRLIVLGKKGQGKSSFIKTIVGLMKKDPNNDGGSIHMNGTKAVSFNE